MTTPTRLDDVAAYPLVWPQERKRLPGHQRERSKRWNGSFQTAMQDLEIELHKASIHSWVLSSNLRPHSRAASSVEDPAVAVWFNQRVRGAWTLSVLACDRYSELWINLRAISMTLNRLRLIDDYGVYTVDQAIQGAAYVALPGPQTPPDRPWRDVLTIDGLAPATATGVNGHYRFLAAKWSSNQDKLKELNIARDAARRELGVTE